MSSISREVRVYADWDGLNGPCLMGQLAMDRVRGKEIFSFEYDGEWLSRGLVQQLDPELQLFAGKQYLRDVKQNFGIFLDSSPDRWGRLLMRRREACLARRDKRAEERLTELDYLLGVYDGQRMGAIRFQEGDRNCYLNSDEQMATPPWTSLRDLEYASLRFEESDLKDDNETLKWLNQLLAPGSSLGGARPKAGVVDEKGRLWIAKFPSRSDRVDTGAWECVVHELARKAGLQVPEASARLFTSQHHTFLSRRFDRTSSGQRHHFASAMTLLGYADGASAVSGVSYLEIADFIMRQGAAPQTDLSELWRRIVFNICVSNTDDHLRNHGFILAAKEGWRLSPAYDMNPNPQGDGLTLNISENDNRLDLELALEVAESFHLDLLHAKEMMGMIRHAVKQWRLVATRQKIPKAEQEKMALAFQRAGSL
jgi:serine/threonine-protein kinase HipA